MSKNEPRLHKHRVTIAENEGYEITYFAQKHHISIRQAREIIERVGNNRTALNAAAAKVPKLPVKLGRGPARGSGR